MSRSALTSFSLLLLFAFSARGQEPRSGAISFVPYSLKTYDQQEHPAELGKLRVPENRSKKVPVGADNHRRLFDLLRIVRLDEIDDIQGCKTSFSNDRSRSYGFNCGEASCSSAMRPFAASGACTFDSAMMLAAEIPLP